VKRYIETVPKRGYRFAGTVTTQIEEVRSDQVAEVQIVSASAEAVEQPFSPATPQIIE